MDHKYTKETARTQKYSTRYTRKFPATLLADFYKISHRAQYPEGTQIVYSTWIPRTSRINGVYKVVAFGTQAFIKKYLIDYFGENFFSQKKEEVVADYKRVISATLGDQNPDASHIEALHDLGYLPLLIKAVPEGTRVPLRVPTVTIENTDPRFFWLTNYIETLFSCENWLAATSATQAFEYRRLLEYFANETGGDLMVTQFQGHDFSMRGMACLEAAQLSGAGHLLSFSGTDTIPAIGFLEQFYNADVEKELVGTSIPATEHSVMCAGGENDEEATYRRLICDVYPKGFLSIVSDTWDFWHTMDTIVPNLKEQILHRDGKIVIRPDSGDPVKIICGDPTSDDWRAKKGAIEMLWDTFGGTVNEKGFKVLDPHIGCIYGDAITLQRCFQICTLLKMKGFASTNVVFGIGSFTFQYCTRDTFGWALKSTSVTINGEEKAIFKDPKTDNGVKKSLKGRCVVIPDYATGNHQVIDGLHIGNNCTLVDDTGKCFSEENNLLQPVFLNGELFRDESLAEIRERLHQQLYPEPNPLAVMSADI
jgi:nicotinamide phosphoribosyltransferase